MPLRLAPIPRVSPEGITARARTSRESDRDRAPAPLRPRRSGPDHVGQHAVRRSGAAQERANAGRMKSPSARRAGPSDGRSCGTRGAPAQARGTGGNEPSGSSRRVASRRSSGVESLSSRLMKRAVVRLRAVTGVDPSVHAAASVDRSATCVELRAESCHGKSSASCGNSVSRPRSRGGRRTRFAWATCQVRSDRWAQAVKLASFASRSPVSAHSAPPAAQSSSFAA